MESAKQIIQWQGYAIEFGCQTNPFNLRQSVGINMVHIELRTLVPAKAPLPVTETGYRSHFINAEVVAEYESSATYVLAWLDHEAQKPEWQQREIEARQYSLL